MGRDIGTSKSGQSFPFLFSEKQNIKIT